MREGDISPCLAELADKTYEEVSWTENSKRKTSKTKYETATQIKRRSAKKIWFSPFPDPGTPINNNGGK